MSSSSSTSRSTSATSALGPRQRDLVAADVHVDLRERPLDGAQQLVARAEQGHHLDVVGDDDRVLGDVGAGLLPGEPRRRLRAGRCGRQSSWGKSTRPHRPSCARESRSQPGGQVMRAAAEHVQVGVEHALLGGLPGVGDQCGSPAQALLVRRPRAASATTSASSSGVRREGRRGRARAAAGRRARGSAPAGRCRGRRGSARVSATTSIGTSPETMRQKRQLAVVRSCLRI